MKCLDSLVQSLHLASVLQNRVVLGEPWGVTFHPSPDKAQFHFAEVGEAVLMVEGFDPVRLQQGDLAIVFAQVPHSVVDRHLSPPTCVKTLVERANVLCESGITLHFGGEGPESAFITGVFEFQDAETHPLIRNLPPFIVLRGENGQAPDWIDATLRLISSESMEPRPGVRTVLDHLCGVLFIQSLRGWVRCEASEGLPLALQDRAIDQALTLIQTQPEQPWTIERLAQRVSMSRSAFAERFRRLLGDTPMDYLLRWRMHLAVQLLRAGSESTYAIAQRVGYESEASFAKAFKRTVGATPGSFRRAG